MKLRALSAGLALLFVLSLVSCASARPEVVVTCEDFNTSRFVNRTINVRERDSITVTVCSANASQGYRWSETAIIDDLTTIRQIDQRYIIPPENAQGEDAADKQQWTFVALKPGSTKIELDYSQPWEGGDKKYGVFKITVNIK